MKNEFQQNIGEFGLLGRNIEYSFSRNYFREKFEREGINASYRNFDIPKIQDLKKVLKGNRDLKGLNVTIPYKEEILPYLDEIDSVAKEIGAVNTVKIFSDGSLKGFNTDYFGFSEAIKPFLRPHHKKALILGTGGASKAISYALNSLQTSPFYVSRASNNGDFTYDDLNKTTMEEHLVIINCTPLGTFPKTTEFPPIPTEFITKEHLVFDLIYNPAITKLMELTAKKGAVVSNGLRMLELQAEKSWELWN